MSNVSILAVEAQPDPEVINALLDMLAKARAGRLQGFVAFSSNTEWRAGALELRDAVLCFEAWKHDMLSQMREQRR